ncbi:MAG: rod shape-determining protein MreC [Bordetella sp.]|nr:MAG: rod shape-determining protein MreC [Bordetella sp.]
MQKKYIPNLFHHGISVFAKFLLLATVSVLLLLIDSKYSFFDPLRKTISSIIYPFQRIVLIPKHAFKKINDWIEIANSIDYKSEILQQQKIKLIELMVHKLQITEENNELKRLLGIKKLSKQIPIAVEVFYEPNKFFNHRLIINQGSKSGLDIGIPIIDEYGLVGQIVRISSMTSEIALIGESNTSIPVKNSRNGLRLIAFGSGSLRKLEIRYLSENSDIKIGDVFVTSGIGGIFPPGLPVAKVTEIQIDKISGFKLAVLEGFSFPENHRYFLALKTVFENDNSENS